MGTNIGNIRRDIAGGTDQSIQTKTIQNNSVTCPECKQGTMMTILVINGYGNIITDHLTDEENCIKTAILDST